MLSIFTTTVSMLKWKIMLKHNKYWVSKINVSSLDYRYINVLSVISKFAFYLFIQFFFFIYLFFSFRPEDVSVTKSLN